MLMYIQARALILYDQLLESGQTSKKVEAVFKRNPRNH